MKFIFNIDEFPLGTRSLLEYIKSGTLLIGTCLNTKIYVRSLGITSKVVVIRFEPNYIILLIKVPKFYIMFKKKMFYSCFTAAVISLALLDQLLLGCRFIQF